MIEMPKAPSRVLEILTELDQKDYIKKLYPSHAYIASELGYCRKTVTRAMKWLKDNNFLKWVGQIARNGWCRTTNLYTILASSTKLPDDSTKIEENNSNTQNVPSKDIKPIHKYNNKLTKDTYSPDRKITAEFLKAWFHDKPVTFQVIAETDKAKQLAESGYKFRNRIFHGSLLDHYETLLKYNANGYGIHVAVNDTDQQGRCKENIIGTNGFVLDLDGGSLDFVIEKTKQHDIEPTMIIETSPGRYHVYWKCDDCPLEKWQGIQKTIGARFDGDANSMSINKTLRLPGFNHLKAEPFLVKIIHFSFNVVEFDKMNRLFPAPKPKPINRDFKPTGKMWDNPQYGESQGGREDGLYRFVCRMEKFGLSRDEAEHHAIKYAFACSPELTEKLAIKNVATVWINYR